MNLIQQTFICFFLITLLLGFAALGSNNNNSGNSTAQKEIPINDTPKDTPKETTTDIIIPDPTPAATPEPINQVSDDYKKKLEEDQLNSSPDDSSSSDETISDSSSAVTKTTTDTSSSVTNTENSAKEDQTDNAQPIYWSATIKKGGYKVGDQTLTASEGKPIYIKNDVTFDSQGGICIPDLAGKRVKLIVQEV